MEGCRALLGWMASEPGLTAEGTLWLLDSVASGTS